ncbi:MAG: dipicolinate synthase subunit B [Clostridia bacterium]|nr:dipicolinate synthase subunit B [Clostridia bacterium]
MIKNIGFALTGCFCAHQNVVVEIENLIKKGYNIIPIISETTSKTSTRFGNAEELKKQLLDITRNQPLDSIVAVEPTGPKNMLDIIVVAPCSGNTIAKIANGVNDTCVTMAVKSHLRNNKPVVIGVSTNDALGANFKNIATLMSVKNVYFVPFGQDDFQNKPKSLVADWSLIEQTMLMAINKEQIQPVLL